MDSKSILRFISTEKSPSCIRRFTVPEAYPAFTNRRTASATIANIAAQQPKAIKSVISVRAAPIRKGVTERIHSTTPVVISERLFIFIKGQRCSMTSSASYSGRISVLSRNSYCLPIFDALMNPATAWAIMMNIPTTPIGAAAAS